jgi:flagellar basal-body rod protein FlgC
MNPLKATMQAASAGMQRETQRLGLASENISNADTPGYRRKLIVGAAPISGSDAFQAARIALDETAGALEYNPAHPLANGEGYVTGSNVSLVIELADMREANRSYEANLNAFQQARTMYKSLLDVLRR